MRRLAAVRSRADDALLCEREAQREFLEAEENRLAGDVETAEFHYEMAENLKRRRSELLKVQGDLTLSVDGEVVEDKGFRDSMEEPNAVYTAASANRFDLLEEAGVLAPGLDAAQSIDALNSLEKMLAHQMVLCHDQSFRLVSQANSEQNTVEKARLINASARMMKSFQDGLLCLNRIRTGGTQRVIVQHVQVNDGGQAVVAGQVGRGRDGGG
jgi:hypothetical protein